MILTMYLNVRLVDITHLTNMKELKKRQKELKEFLEDMKVDKTVTDIAIRSLETAYLQGRIDQLESKYAQNNKK